MFYNFNPNLPEPFNVIHPIQTESVRRFLSNAFPDEVEEIILFGSSLDFACGRDSDLDLYVVADTEDEFRIYEAVRELCLPLRKRFDILVSNADNFRESSEIFGTVENEVMQRGVRIYAKTKNYAAGQGEGGFKNGEGHA